MAARDSNSLPPEEKSSLSHLRSGALGAWRMSAVKNTTVFDNSVGAKSYSRLLIHWAVSGSRSRGGASQVQG
jgi:hypothetical protein